MGANWFCLVTVSKSALSLLTLLAASAGAHAESVSYALGSARYLNTSTQPVAYDSYGRPVLNPPRYAGHGAVSQHAGAASASYHHAASPPPPSDNMSAPGAPSIHSGPPPKERSNWYAGLNIGLVLVEDIVASQTAGTQTETATFEFSPTARFGAVGGYHLYPYFRVEGEFAYRNHGVDSAIAKRFQNGQLIETTNLEENLEENETLALKVVTTMVNAYIDFPLSDYIYVSPYVGAGAGWLFQIDGAEENMFAWQAMAGVSYPLDDGKSNLSFGYRYFEAPNFFDSDIHDFDALSHQVELAYRSRF